MIKQLGTIALALTAVQLGIAPEGAADEKGLLLGIGAGTSKFDADADFDIDLRADGVPIVFTTRELDDSDTAFYGSVGYRFSRHFAAEAEYMELGEFVFVTSAPVPGSSSEVLSLRLESGVKGYAVSALGIMPLNDRWELFGRIGQLFADSTTTVRLGALSLADSERSEATVLGIGGALELRERLELRLEYRAFDDDVSAVMVGLVFRPIR
jgi:OOP family OmpA-OmpF porin